MMFTPKLPNVDCHPDLEDLPGALAGEIQIGEDDQARKFYTLRVLLGRPTYIEDVDLRIAELMFYVAVYDYDDPTNWSILWSGADTRRIFPAPDFRSQIVQFVARIAACLVKLEEPTELIMMVKDENLPVVAYNKYEILKNRLVELGYECNTSQTYDGRRTWHFVKL